MNKKEKSFFASAWKCIKVAALIGFTLLTWTASFWAIRNSNIYTIQRPDLYNILLGTSSLALFVFSIFIALLAIVGWQAVKDIIKEKVDIATNSKVESLENEIRGRTLSILGYSLGEMSLAPKTLEIIDQERFSEAVSLCNKGYEFLSKVGGAAEFMALNNLVYYSFLYGDESMRGSLLDKARRLKKAGLEHNARNLQLTAYGVILRYGTDQAEIKEAKEMLIAIGRSQLAPEKQRKEAKRYLASSSALTTESSAPTKN